MNYRYMILAGILTTMLAAVPASALDWQDRQFHGQGVVALPIGDFGDISSVGAGAGLAMTVPHGQQLSFRGELSYLYFSDDLDTSEDVSLYQIPILVLAQYSISDTPAYLLGGLGLAFTHFDFGLGEVEGIDTSATETDLALALGLGTHLSERMILEGRLNLVSDANSVSAHLGFLF